MFNRHPGMRADEQPDPRDEEEPEGAGPGPQGGADHHLGHGGPLQLPLLRPGAALATACSWRQQIGTRRGSPVVRRPSTAEAPPTGENHPFSKMAVTFEPLIGF